MKDSAKQLSLSPFNNDCEALFSPSGFRFSNAELQCDKCPRLVEYRRSIEPKPKFAGVCYHNAPVLPSGDPNGPWLLIVGLAPGAHGANRTGINFMGDGAGTLLYEALFQCGLSSRGNVHDHTHVELYGVMITNAVRCVPPQNKPTNDEFQACRPNLMGLLQLKESIADILCIGADAWREIHTAFECKMPKFAHGAISVVSSYRLYASFHTSTYNQNTGRVNLSMLTDLLKNILKSRDVPDKDA